jgi:hypothetical protein
MSLSNGFSPENHVSDIFNQEGEAGIEATIAGCAEVMEVWHLGDISAGVRPEDFLRAQSLLTAGVSFLFAERHKGQRPTESQLASMRLDALKAMREIMRS